MEISPDNIYFFQIGPIAINATLVFTWITMAVILCICLFVTRKLETGAKLSRLQNMLETVIKAMREQIYAISRQKTDMFLPLVGTLFLFIAFSIVLGIIPGFTSPTGSLSTTAALAICVFFSVPIFGIKKRGFKGYLKHYLRPTPFMLPFNILGELSRTIALAVRLFGNVMSGTIIIAILLTIVPFFFPIVMQALGLLTGLIQAYIFAVLTTVYIASATQAYEKKESKNKEGSK